ncbi:MAG: beta-N-acetylhexosaminidase [Deltaproteobacteria bacterium]|nr:MAG: beta-N-acetylhexosaminidase [Deltaproteobacteria bacterium]
MSATGTSTTAAERRRRAGRRLIIGFSGGEVTSELREVVREIQPGGFILFSRNVENPRQVRDLNRALRDLLPGRPLLISVDQEGGRVQRIREPATHWPTLREVGAADASLEIAQALGLELRAMGFNLNFAPVADVDSNPANPVIGDRSFGRDPARVGAQVQAFTRGLQAQGILACAKHFPGHGDTSTDSHLELPQIDREEQSLRSVELPPFAAAVAAGVASIMTAHVVFSAWDPHWPATLSTRVIPEILREGMGFRNLVITDDLEMKAVADRYPLAEQVRRTLLGTVDLALACHRAELQLELFAESIKAQEQDPELARLAARSEDRFLRLVVPTLLSDRDPPPIEVVGSERHQALADQVRRAAAPRLG